MLVSPPPSIALPVPVVTISTSGVPTVGQTYALICSVMVVPGLVEEPTVQWTTQSGTVTNSSSATRLELNFNPLITTDSDLYTCRASINIIDVVSLTGETSREILLTGRSYKSLCVGNSF